MERCPRLLLALCMLASITDAFHVKSYMGSRMLGPRAPLPVRWSKPKDTTHRPPAPPALRSLRMPSTPIDDMEQLTAFYESKGYGGKEAVQKAEQELQRRSQHQLEVLRLQSTVGAVPAPPPAHDKEPTKRIGFQVNDEEELQERITRAFKRLKLLEETGKPKGPLSRSEWVKALVDEKKITVNKDLIDSLTKPASTRHLPLPSLEHFLIVGRGEEPKDKLIKGTRELFGEVLKTWAVPNRTQDVSSTTVPTLGTHKPDHLMRVEGRSGEQSIITAGEIKAMSDKQPHGEFGDEEVGQELDFLQMALILQPWRTFVYGFLTDTRRFEFFRAVRDPSKGTTFERSGVYTDQAGWVALQTLLSQPDEVLGFQDVSVPGWELLCWLGSGATSAVFSASNVNGNGPEAVCKMYISHTDGKAQREREGRALGVLYDLPNVPHPVQGAPVKTRCGLSVLIKTPIGMTIPDQLRAPVSAYAPLVATLQIAHQRGLFHNDVSPSSMFAVRRGGAGYEMLLNDWGSAATAADIAAGDNIGTRKLYYNTSTRDFGAAADLCALVRSVFYLTQATFNSSDTNTCAELDAIMEKQLPVWREALALARAANYDGLKDLLQR